MGWWRGGWVLAVLVAAAPGYALEVSSLRMRATAAGEEVVVEFDAPASLTVEEVRTGDGVLSRLHIEFPPGTRLAAGVSRVLPAAGPVDQGRVGVAEDGSLRLVLDLAGAVRHQLTHQAGGRVVVVAIDGSPRARTPTLGAVTPTTLPAPSAETSPLPSVAKPAPAKSVPKIVLDPGHGGDDPGAIAHAVEKDVTLAIASDLAKLLRTRLGATVVLTRSTDVTVALKDRTARANAEDADLFVSIHANANPSGTLRGVETYYLNNSQDRATLRLAAMENGLGTLGTPGKDADLKYILSDLVQGGKMDASIRLASGLQRALVGQLRRKWRGIVDLGVKKGPFYVLVGAHMPCVLVETAFLSHPVEGPRLARRDYQQAVAEGLYRGIARFLQDAARQRTL